MKVSYLKQRKMLIQNHLIKFSPQKSQTFLFTLDLSKLYLYLHGTNSLRETPSPRIPHSTSWGGFYLILHSEGGGGGGGGDRLLAGLLNPSLSSHSSRSASICIQHDLPNSSNSSLTFTSPSFSFLSLLLFLFPEYINPSTSVLRTLSRPPRSVLLPHLVLHCCPRLSMTSSSSCRASASHTGAQAPRYACTLCQGDPNQRAM